MSYYRFNNLAELLNRYLAAKIGRGILFTELMDRECNCSVPYKLNVKFVYEGKFRYKCLIYEVKCLMCDAIYIGKTQQTLKKRMGGHFSDLLRLLNNIKKSDSFSDHSEKIFYTTTSHTDLRKYMTFKGVKQINPIGAMETFTKPNCNLCMEKQLIILKKLLEKCVTVMNKNLDIYGACRHKTTVY